MLPVLYKKIIEFNENEVILIILNDEKEIYDIYNYLINFIDKDFIGIFYSIPLEPYEFKKYDLLRTYNRIKFLYNDIIKSTKKIILLDIKAFIYPVISHNNLINKQITLYKSLKLKQEEFQKFLFEAGYKQVEEPTFYGDFSRKGEIFNIYFSPLENPVKIDFFDDMIEFIKIYERDTGKIINEIDSINILPIREFFLKNKLEILIELSKINYYDENISNIIDSIKNEYDWASIWYLNEGDRNFIVDYFVLLNKNLRIIFYNYDKIKENYIKVLDSFDLLMDSEKKKIVSPKENIIFDLNKINNLGKIKKIKILNNDISNILKNSFIDKNLLKNKNINSNENNFNIDDFNNDKDVIQNYLNYKKNDLVDFEIYSLNPYDNDFEKFETDINILKKFGYKVIISGNKYQIDRINNLFKNISFEYLNIELNSGFIDSIDKISLFSYNDIIKEKIKIKKDDSFEVKTIEDYLDIKPGEYIVHIKYGIGIYKGIKTINVEGEYKDYLSIQYQNDEELNVPIEKIEFLQKYISFGNIKPKLDSLSKKSWKKTVEETKNKIYEFALSLYNLYKLRKKEIGISFLKDNEEMKKFEDEFEYIETYDQLKAIEEVKNDMESSYPMDRLICGDVGFGKTEIVMRAAFKAVYSGYQVLFICPTTVLANQHYEVFLKRFKNFPVNIGVISRLIPKDEQKIVLEKLKDGNIDILIGTHRALSKDVKFKNLGLLIIDEEQKFGVKHKEDLKILKSDIDVLSLSATPIPRTLYLSLIKLRPVSVINTPPENRKPINVIVDKFSEDIIKKAIEHELLRGGKIYIIHNRVETIAQFTAYINSILNNNLKITYIHARMPKENIRERILKFIKSEIRVIVSTTIIESGIDIPDVDTIIIDEADKFGLSSLYQLKGRVGRRDKEAYAYLLYRIENSASIGMKRLQIIEDYAELGSGYKVALKDLEIRGYGEILGKEQSGYISRVGFNMYKILLENVINEIENKEKEKYNKCEIEIETNGFIPENYINCKDLRFNIYQKLYLIDYMDELINYKNEIENNFGKIPEELNKLFEINFLRIKSQYKKIDKIWENRDDIIIIFNNETKLKIENLIEKVKKNEIFIDKKNKNMIKIKNSFISFEEKINFLNSIIDNIFEK